MGSSSIQKRAANGTSFASVAPTPLQSDLKALEAPPCDQHKIPISILLYSLWNCPS